MTEPVRWMVLVVAAYLLGSTSFALIIGKLRGVDIRLHGSGNVGASNVGRILGRPLGIFCFVLDVLKGFIPVFFGGIWLGALNLTFTMAATTPEAANPPPAQNWTTVVMWLTVGAAAIVGHTNSIYLNFKGGKGVATGFGVMLGIWPYLTIPVLLALVVWLIAIRTGRIISLASILGASSLPLWFLLLSITGWTSPLVGGSPSDTSPAHRFATQWPFLITAVLLALWVVWKHRTNISRICAGTEPHIGEKHKEHENLGGVSDQ